MNVSLQIEELQKEVSLLKTQMLYLLSRVDDIQINEPLSLDTPIKLDRKIIEKSLSFSTPILGAAYLFKQFFMSDDKDSPLKLINSKRIDYWKDGQWIQSNRNIITRLIYINIRNCYTKFNKLKIVGRDIFRNNQQRIHLLNQVKVQKELITQLLNEL